MNPPVAALCLLAAALGCVPLGAGEVPPLPERAGDALAQADDLAFTGRFCVWLESLDAKGIASARLAVLENRRANAWSATRHREALALLDRRWATLDPGGFLADCVIHRADRDTRAQGAALLARFAEDREAAMVLYAEMPLRDAPQSALRCFLIRAAEKDPAWLVRRCQRFPEWEFPESLVPSNLYITWARSDPSAAWAAMLEEPSYELREVTGFRMLMGQLGKPPEQSVAWLKATPEINDRIEISDAFFGTLSNTGRHDAGLPILRLWNDSVGWESLAKHHPSATPPERWVREIIPLIPDAHRVRALMAFFESRNRRIPVEGEPSDPVFDAIGDAKLQRDLRIAAVASGDYALRPPEDPKPPPPSAGTLRGSFWNEPETFRWLTDIHGIHPAEWMKTEFAANPAAALDRLLARPDTRMLESDADVLAGLLTDEACRDKSLALQDMPGPAARIAGMSLAASWIKRDPKDAIPTLDARHPAALAKILTDRFYLIDGVCENLGTDRTRDLFSSISHPAAKAIALKRITSRSDLHDTVTEASVARLASMPPSRARQEEAARLARKLAASMHPPSAAVLRSVLALDAAVAGDSRDDLLVAIAGRMDANADGAAPQLPEIVGAIRDPSKRFHLLESNLSRNPPAGREIGLMDLLAGFPASDARTRMLTALARHPSPAVLLRAAQGKHPPCVRAAVIRSLLERGDSRIQPDTVMAELAALPPDWLTDEMRRISRTYRAKVNPAAVWPELAAAIREGDGSAANDAQAALDAWMQTDPQAALAGWLATGPSKKLQGSASDLAKAIWIPAIKAGRDPGFPAADRAGWLETAVIRDLSRTPTHALAASRCLALGSGKRMDMLGQVVFSWSLPAADWIGMLAPGDDFRMAASALLEARWKSDPQAARQLLERFAQRDPALIAELPEPIKASVGKPGLKPVAAEPGISAIGDNPDRLASALQAAAAITARADATRALLAGHTGEALRAAMVLEDAEAAPLVARILEALPNESERANAILSLPDDPARTRARRLAATPPSGR